MHFLLASPSSSASSHAAPSVLSMATRLTTSESGRVRRLEEKHQRMFAAEVVAAAAVNAASTPAAPIASSAAAAPSASALSAAKVPRHRAALMRFMQSRRAKYLDTVEYAAEWPTLLDSEAADEHEFDEETAGHVSTTLTHWLVALDRTNVARRAAESAGTALSTKKTRLQRTVKALDFHDGLAKGYSTDLEWVNTLQDSTIERCEEAIGTITSLALEGAQRTVDKEAGVLRAVVRRLAEAKKEVAAVPPISSPPLADSSDYRALLRRLRLVEARASHCEALHANIDARDGLIAVYEATLDEEEWGDEEIMVQRAIDAYEPIGALKAGVVQAFNAVYRVLKESDGSVEDISQPEAPAAVDEFDCAYKCASAMHKATNKSEVDDAVAVHQASAAARAHAADVAAQQNSARSDVPSALPPSSASAAAAAPSAPSAAPLRRSPLMKGLPLDTPGARRGNESSQPIVVDAEEEQEEVAVKSDPAAASASSAPSAAAAPLWNQAAARTRTHAALNACRRPARQFLNSLNSVHWLQMQLVSRFEVTYVGGRAQSISDAQERVVDRQKALRLSSEQVDAAENAALAVSPAAANDDDLALRLRFDANFERHVHRGVLHSLVLAHLDLIEEYEGACRGIGGWTDMLPKIRRMAQECKALDLLEKADSHAVQNVQKVIKANGVEAKAGTPADAAAEAADVADAVEFIFSAGQKHDTLATAIEAADDAQKDAEERVAQLAAQQAAAKKVLSAARAKSEELDEQLDEQHSKISFFSASESLHRALTTVLRLHTAATDPAHRPSAHEVEAAERALAATAEKHREYRLAGDWEAPLTVTAKQYARIMPAVKGLIAAQRRLLELYEAANTDERRAGMKAATDRLKAASEEFDEETAAESIACGEIERGGDCCRGRTPCVWWRQKSGKSPRNVS
jgi:hypothetical protein